MKNLITLLIILSLYSCSKGDDGTISSLPEITSEGNNTFGCFINGEIFLPRNNYGFNSGNVLRAKYAHYPNGYYSLGSGYHLIISAANFLTNKTVIIELENGDQPIISGETYPIVLKFDGSISAEYSFSTSVQGYHNSFRYITTNERIGEITFNLVDESNRIISGVFNFDSINNENDETAEIIDGRFDIIYENSF